MIKLKTILLEYSEKVFKELITRYKAQNHNLDEEIIRAYIIRFDQLKGSIRQRFEANDPAVTKLLPKDIQEKNKYLDILLWKRFTDLEKIVDLFPASKSSQKKSLEINMAETDADEIYNDNGLEIYKGDNENRCIKYGKSQTYSWCISRIGAQNMYNSYRFQQGGSRMFYFIFDKDRSSRKSSHGFDDKYHATVIHVYENGSYALTNSNNSGDSAFKKWDDLSTIVPAELWKKLKPLKNLFTYHAPTQDELEMAAIKGKRLTLDQFAGLGYNVKKQYVQANAKDGLTTEQFKLLDFDLKNMAINFDRRCSFDELKTNMGLLKRYPDYRFTRHEKEAIPYEFIPFLKADLQESYYDKFEKENLTFFEIEKYFDTKPIEGNKFVHDPKRPILNKYLNMQLDKYGFLPEEAEKYMDENQKKIYKAYSVASKDVIYYGDYTSAMDIVPSRIAMIPELSYKTFKSIDPNERKAFIEVIKKLGINVKNTSPDRNNEFFIGVPTTLLYNGRFYFVMPIEPNITEFLICNEDGIQISKVFSFIKAMNGTKELPENSDVSRQVGSKTFWIPENEFTNFKTSSGNIEKTLLKEAQQDRDMMLSRARLR